MRLLVKLYNNRCMISGCIAEQALEAAHIEPYAFAKCNIMENGLLLRADIHTLFDKLLISIHPGNLTVAVSNKIAHSEYAAFSGVYILPSPSLNLEVFKEKLEASFTLFDGGKTSQ